jgi:hypothetical protein
MQQVIAGLILGDHSQSEVVSKYFHRQLGRGAERS